MRASALARLQGIKPAVLPGSKDLQWPPTASMQDPMGMAPYLPRFREVLAMTFPAGETKPKVKEVVAVQPQGDPLAAMKQMVADARPALAAPVQPLNVEVPNGR